MEKWASILCSVGVPTERGSYVAQKLIEEGYSTKLTREERFRILADVVGGEIAAVLSDTLISYDDEILEKQYKGILSRSNKKEKKEKTIQRYGSLKCKNLKYSEQ